MARAGLERPQLCSGLGVQGEEMAFRIPGEYEVARGSEHRCQQRIFGWIAPGSLSGDRIVGVQVAARCAVERLFQVVQAAEEVLAFLGVLLAGRELLAPFDAGRIEEPGARGIGAVIPTAPAAYGRADECRNVDFRLIPPDQVALLVDAVGPIDIL